MYQWLSSSDWLRVAPVDGLLLSHQDDVGARLGDRVGVSALEALLQLQSAAVGQDAVACVEASRNLN